MTRDDLYALHTHCSANSLRYYLDNVTINSSPRPAPWGTIREWWQDDVVGPKIPAFENLADLPGASPYTGPRSFFDILARGHDKSSLEGRLASGLLLCSRRPIVGYIVAADRDQGALLKQAMKEEADLNPWVSSQLKFTRNLVEGPGGSIEIVPADAGGAFGARGNLFIFDEVTNWNKPVCKDVYDAVMSGTEKRDPRVVCLISNAGTYESWQHKIWLAAQSNPDYATFYRKGQLASWMTKARVDALRAQLSSRAEARRVFDNEWIAAGEDNDFLSLQECLACSDANLFYRYRRYPGVKDYVASIDYGPKRDRTVLTVGHKDLSGRCIVDRMDVWEGKSSPGGIVQPSRVRAWIKEVEDSFNPVEYVIDPAGLNSELEWLHAENYPVYEYVSRGGKAQTELAVVLRSQITSGGVHWYPNCGKLASEDTLENELSRLVTKQMPYGFRIDHESSLHDDRAVALGMLLVRLAKTA